MPAGARYTPDVLAQSDGRGVDLALAVEELTKIEEMIARVKAREDLSRVEEALRRRRGELTAKAPVSEVVEYRPHADGVLQAEIRRYARKDGATGAVHGPYWYYKYHEGGRGKTLYLGKTDDPEAALVAKRKAAP